MRIDRLRAEMGDELRERCIRKYGEDFASIYDGIRDGGAILDMYESLMFIEAIDEERRKMRNKTKWTQE
jgi:hypothetical protein